MNASRAGLIAVLALATLTCFYGLGSGPPLGDHESINALGARSCLQTGNWLIPEVGDVARVRKTPLGIWLIGAASYLTGHPNAALPVTQLSARLPSAIAGVLNCLAVYWLGAMLFGRRGGLVAGLVCAGCAGTILYAHNAQVDMVLALFTTLSFACFWRGAMQEPRSRWAMAAFYVAFSLAMLAKAPLPLATVGLSLGVYWLVTLPTLQATGAFVGHGGTPSERWRSALRERLRAVRGLWLVPGVALFLLVVAAWPVYVAFHVGNVLALWGVEYVDRFTGEMTERSWPFWYYVPILLGLTAPFMFSLPEALASPFVSRYAERRRALLYPFTWAVVGTLFLSAAAFKRPHYLLSMLPAYCLLLAPVIERVFFDRLAATRRRVVTTCVIIPVILVVVGSGGGWLIHRDYPALVGTYAVAVGAALLLWTAAAWTYARGQRTASFALMNLGVPVMLIAAFPAIARGVEFNPESKALAAELIKHGVGPQDEIYWVEGRPDSSIEFSSGLKLRRLVSEMDMMAWRGKRGTTTAKLFENFAQRIRDVLTADHPVFLIISAAHYERLEQTAGIRSDIVFRLGGFQQKPSKDLVVFTQPRGEGVSAAPSPAGPTDWCFASAHRQVSAIPSAHVPWAIARASWRLPMPPAHSDKSRHWVVRPFQGRSNWGQAPTVGDAALAHGYCLSALQAEFGAIHNLSTDRAPNGRARFRAAEGSPGPLASRSRLVRMALNRAQ